MLLLGIRNRHHSGCVSLYWRVVFIPRSGFKIPPLEAMGITQIHLDSLSEIHPSPLTAVSRPGVRVSNSVAVFGGLPLTALASVPRTATDSMGDWMGRSDRVFGRSRVVSTQSLAAGWVAGAVASSD